LPPLFSSVITEHQQVIDALQRSIGPIEKAGEFIVSSFEAGQRVFLCGNGGSAADSQHIAAEFMVRYVDVRRPLPAIALTTDTSILTAHTNDYDFNSVFSRQIEALGQAGDCLIAISTSGNSGNIVAAINAAKDLGIKTIGMTGQSGGQLTALADILVTVPSDVTARIQEAHILIGHWWCELADQQFQNTQAQAESFS
jgi:D-sedoheptulose 7-phosphate isomerase